MLLCHNFNPTDTFTRSLTHPTYKVKNFDSNSNISCSSTNCVYLITCLRCGLQYVGETVQSLRDRFSSHRAGMKNPDNNKSKCRILSELFGTGLCKGAKYKVNIIEKLEGSGRDENGKTK